jgi:predicted O-linked N-acetylglucosamine transferase (SPINDLY family)
MQNQFAEVTPRNSDPMAAAAGLSDEARKAVNAAFDAMSAWRIETAKNSEKNIEQVVEKMAAAARALGWPEEIVETTRAQMQSITKMQIQVMDHVMDAWEEQLKAPSSVTPSAMMSKLKSLPGFSAASSWPSADAFQAAATNPMQFWMEFAEQWQKATAEAMAFWTKGGKASDAAGRSRR